MERMDIPYQTAIGLMLGIYDAEKIKRIEDLSQERALFDTKWYLLKGTIGAIISTSLASAHLIACIVTAGIILHVIGVI